MYVLPIFAQLRCPSTLYCRNRGTEYMKSPEMLVVGNATKQTRSNHDRRRGGREQARLRTCGPWAACCTSC